MGIIEAKKLIFEYIRRDEEGNVEGITRAVDEVDLDIKQGDFVAILGHNGSGKSTLAKHLNAILYPTEGTVWVDGKDTAKEEYLWEIRQKQRVSIAGVIAMHPKCIILDEPTAMLDPNGRKEVIRAVRALNHAEGITVVLITHYMEEIIHADKAIVMDKGHIAMQGSPREIFSQVEKLKELRLDVPQVTLLAYELKKSGVTLPDGILTYEELIAALSV